MCIKNPRDSTTKISDLKMNRATGHSGVQSQGARQLARMRSRSPRGGAGAAEVCQPAMPDGVFSGAASSAMERARDPLHWRRTTEQHVPAVEVRVKGRRTASLSNHECHMYLGRSQQQQVPVLDFQAELRPAFLAETPRDG